MTDWDNREPDLTDHPESAQYKYERYLRTQSRADDDGRLR